MEPINDSGEKVTALPEKDPEMAAATEQAAAEVPDAVDRAGDNTPTKPGTEAAKASAGTQDHSKHPPSERAEDAAIAISGSPDTAQK